MAKKKKTYSTKQLIAAGKDMTISMILQPSVEVEGDDDEIISSIKHESQELRSGDRLLPETIELLRDLGIEMPTVKTWTVEQQQAEAARQAEDEGKGDDAAPSSPEEDFDKDPGGIAEGIKKEEAAAKKSPPKKKPPAKTKPLTRAQVFAAIFTTTPVIKERLVKELAEKFGGSWRQAEIQIDIYLRLLVALGFATKTGDKYALKDPKKGK